MNQQSFEETYAQMLDGELAKVLRARRTFVPEARLALDKEIEKRHIDPEKLRKQSPRNIDGPKHPTTLEKRMKHKRLGWQAIVGLMVLSVLLCAALGHFDKLQFFWPVVLAVFIPVFTGWGFWELKGQLWFWAVVLLVVAAQIAIFSVVGWPWGTRWVPARAVEGMCTLELIPIFAGLAWLEKRWQKHHEAESQASVEKL
jgi:hypothetical protein